MSELVTHSGGCHCGAVRFEIDLEARPKVQECTCTICRMTGFVQQHADQEWQAVQRSNPRHLLRGGSLYAHATEGMAGLTVLSFPASGNQEKKPRTVTTGSCAGRSHAMW